MEISVIVAATTQVQQCGGKYEKVYEAKRSKLV